MRKKDVGVGDIGDHHHHASKFPPLKALFNYLMDLHSIGISVPKSNHLERSQNYFI
jgi:hypothetical protein